MFNILLVDDDSALVRALKSYLEKDGYNAVAALSAEEAYEAMYRTSFDCIVSDIMMPGTDGFQFVSQVRELNDKIPVIFVSARDDISAKNKGFRIGIDDYMVKPIEFEELSMRIRAILRRSGIVASRRIEMGDTILDAEERAAYINGEEVVLTVREFNIIFKLLSYPRKTFSRQQLMDEFWDVDSTSSTRTVDVYMTKLRDKFSASQGFDIVTVHGLGYKVVPR